MTDIAQECREACCEDYLPTPCPVGKKAADEIERLQNLLLLIRSLTIQPVIHALINDKLDLSSADVQPASAVQDDGNGHKPKPPLCMFCGRYHFYRCDKMPEFVPAFVPLGTTKSSQ